MPLIVGYIHVCQQGNWQITYDMIMSAAKNSGLYDNSSEIRVGVVNNLDHIIPEERFNDPKIKIIGHGSSQLYERLTLHHLRDSSENEICQYWYTHTKGIRYFDDHDLHKRNCVIDWIRLMIFYNIIKWETATNCLLSNDTYGCEFSVNPCKHYSGNFWWANCQYIRTLPSRIKEGYCDPEFWLLKRDREILIGNVFSSGIDGGSHYTTRVSLDNLP